MSRLQPIEPCFLGIPRLLSVHFALINELARSGTNMTENHDALLTPEVHEIASFD